MNAMPRGQRSDETELPAPAAAPTEEPAIEPVPDEVRDAARRAFALRDPQAEILDLLQDSALDRPGARPRRLVFARSEPPVEVVVVLHGADGDSRLEISCSDAHARLLSVQGTEGSAPGPSDEAGPWLLPATAGGPVSLALVAAGQRLRTAWLRL